MTPAPLALRGLLGKGRRLSNEDRVSTTLTFLAREVRRVHEHADAGLLTQADFRPIAEASLGLMDALRKLPPKTED